MKKALSLIMLCAIFVASFAGAAWASAGGTVGDGSAVGDMLRAVIDAFANGHATEGAFLALVLVVAVARKWGVKRFPFLATGEGAILLVLVASFATAMAASAAGAGVSWAAAYGALKIAAGAAGGYKIVRVVGGLIMRKVSMPAWLKSAIGSALWLFEKPGAKAIADAEKAGDDAVRKNPAPGVGETDVIE